MYTKTINLVLITILSLLFYSCSKSKESEFNGKWQIQSEYFSYNEPTEKSYKDYFIFRDGKYLRKLSGDIYDWDTEGKRYEVKDNKLIMYDKLGDDEINTSYSYEFLSNKQLKLTSEKLGINEGPDDHYVFILNKVADQ